MINGIKVCSITRTVRGNAVTITGGPIGTITKPLRWSTGTRSLAIAVDVQLPYPASTPDRVLPHGRAHGLPFPFDFARQTNVH